MLNSRTSSYKIEKNSISCKGGSPEVLLKFCGYSPNKSEKKYTNKEPFYVYDIEIIIKNDSISKKELIRNILDDSNLIKEMN